MEVVSRARAIGGSIVVTIPKEVVREEHLKPGQLVEIDVRAFKKSFFGALKGIGSFTTGDEMKAHD